MRKLECEESQVNKGRRVKILMKSKLFVSLLVMGFVVMGSSSIFAYYYLSHDSTTTVDISGGISAFGVTQDLAPIIIDVSSNLTDTQNLVLQNDNGNVVMNYGLVVDTTEQDPINCDNTNDVNYKLMRSGVEIVEGGNFTINSGTNNFEFITEVSNDRACPVNSSLSLSFFE